jgi:drug/metabolite transporter (DMT)-like permease
MTRPILIAVVVAIAAISAAGDYFIKLASMESKAIQNRWFLAGTALYLISTFGWVFIMPHMKLASLGVVYSLSLVLLIALLGVFVFGERLNWYEIVGFGLAGVAMFLLTRFS